jgi:hypothetical protein
MLRRDSYWAKTRWMCTVCESCYMLTHHKVDTHGFRILCWSKSFTPDMILNEQRKAELLRLHIFIEWRFWSRGYCIFFLLLEMHRC